MTDPGSQRPDPRDRPYDPAGTRPKVDPDSLLPAPEEEPAVEGEAVEEEPAGAGARRHEWLAERREVLPEVREPVVVPAAPAEPAAEVPDETQHTPRFQFLLGALLAIGTVALAAAVAVSLRSDPAPVDPAAGWSSWRPLGGDPVGQIADHVGREYRLQNGRQLVVISEAGPLAFRDIPAQVVIEDSAGDFNLLKGQGVLYRMCGGAGESCLIPGTPSKRRALLLRREALELALYTFRYVEGVDQVVVLLPGTVKDRGTSLLFRKEGLIPQLLRPLDTTLARRTPTIKGVLTSPDRPNVDRLARPLYEPGLTQNGVSGLLLVLKPWKGPSTSTPPSAPSASSQAQPPAQAQAPSQAQAPTQSGSGGGTSDPSRTEDGLIVP
jgi:hypothetical protein